MMIQYSGLQAKREDMARESDPRNDFEEWSERLQRDEIEVRRELEEVGTNQRDSIDGMQEGLIKRSEEDR